MSYEEAQDPLQTTKPQSGASLFSTHTFARNGKDIDYSLRKLLISKNPPTRNDWGILSSHPIRNTFLQSLSQEFQHDQLPSLVIPKTLGTGPGDPNNNYSNLIMLKTCSARSSEGQNHSTFWGQNRSIIPRTQNCSTILRTKPPIILRKKEEKVNKLRTDPRELGPDHSL